MQGLHHQVSLIDLLKSDYFRIEIGKGGLVPKCLYELKSDYFRIEIRKGQKTDQKDGTAKIRLF